MIDLAESVEYSVWSKLKNPERCKVLAQIVLQSNRKRIEHILSVTEQRDARGRLHPVDPEHRFWALELAAMEILWNAHIRAPTSFDLSRNKRKIAVAVLEEMGATI